MENEMSVLERLIAEFEEMVNEADAEFESAEWADSVAEEMFGNDNS